MAILLSGRVIGRFNSSEDVKIKVTAIPEEDLATISQKCTEFRCVSFQGNQCSV